MTDEQIGLVCESKDRVQHFLSWHPSGNCTEEQINAWWDGLKALAHEQADFLREAGDGRCARDLYAAWIELYERLEDEIESDDQEEIDGWYGFTDFKLVAIRDCIDNIYCEMLRER